MKHLLRSSIASFGLLGALLCGSQEAQAQFSTPIIDGQITGNEYGVNGNTYPGNVPGRNLVWRTTWDAEFLYVAISDVNNIESARESTVLYFDTDPITPVNSGSGSTIAFNGPDYDGTGGTLPFSANLVVFVNRNYDEYRVSTSNGVWSGQTTNTLTKSFRGATNPNDGTVDDNRGTREIRIPWSLFKGNLPNGRPAAFNMLGYITAPNAKDDNKNPIPGYIYGQIPQFTVLTQDGPGSIGKNGKFVRYFTISGTSDGDVNSGPAGPAGPFSRESYTNIPDESDATFGGISVYDFTMNSPGATINRRDNGAVTWDVKGNLVVNQGVINTGNSSNFIYVNKDFTVSSNAQFKLQGNGNLSVAGDFKALGGFSASGSATVTLNGGDQDITTSGGNTSFASLNLTGGSKTLLNDLTITQQLALNNGARLNTGPNRLILAPGSTGLFEGNNGYVIGTVEARASLTAAGSYNFNNIGLTLSIARNGSRMQDYPGVTTVLRVTGTPLSDKRGTEGIKRYYQIIPTYPTGQEVSITFNYRTSNENELNNIPQPQLTFFRSNNFSGPFENLGFPSLTGSSSTVVPERYATLDRQSVINGYFTLGDGARPLPVELASFSGQYANNSVLLKWTTASEKNNKGFGVERRVGEGSNWQQVGFVAGKSATGAAYSYADATAPQGTSYYRLRQEDNDGTTAYSPVVAVLVAGQASGTLALSPVPTTDVLNISGFGDGKHVAEVYNLRGQRVLTQEISNAQATLSVSNLPSGVYLVRVQGANSAQKGKFVKL